MLLECRNIIHQYLQGYVCHFPVIVAMYPFKQTTTWITIVAPWSKKLALRIQRWLQFHKSSQLGISSNTLHAWESKPQKKKQRKQETKEWYHLWFWWKNFFIPQTKAGSQSHTPIWDWREGEAFWERKYCEHKERFMFILLHVWSGFLGGNKGFFLFGVIVTVWNMKWLVGDGGWLPLAGNMFYLTIKDWIMMWVSWTYHLWLSSLEFSFSKSNFGF